MLEKFLNSRASGTSPKTLRIYHLALDRFVGYPLTSEGINTYLNCLTCGNAKHNYYRCIKTLCRWLYRTDYLPTNPIEKVLPPRRQKRLLELFRYRLTPYVLGIPLKAQKLLPDWIGIAQNLGEILQNSIVLMDEAYLSYHSRESLKIQSREVSQIVNLSRQRNQTLIFVTQEARQIDKNIGSQANVIIFKEPAILQLKFD